MCRLASGQSRHYCVHVKYNIPWPHVLLHECSLTRTGRTANNANALKRCRSDRLHTGSFPGLIRGRVRLFQKADAFLTCFSGKISSKKLYVLLHFPSAYIRQALKPITLLHIQPFKKLRVCKSALTALGVAEGGGRGPLPHPLPDRWQADKFTPISAREDLTECAVHGAMRHDHAATGTALFCLSLFVRCSWVRVHQEISIHTLPRGGRQQKQMMQRTGTAGKIKKHREPPKRFPCA